MVDVQQKNEKQDEESELDFEEQQKKALAELEKQQSVINEKLQRCDDFADGKYGVPEHLYTENNPKEELVLEHVIQYKKQFQLVYDENRELFLYPKNECGIYKFICTTIRPTKLGYLEFYEYEECAKYISQFISYEELDPPDKFPTVIPSPANVAKWQAGDCFDISILLCSLLIGVGFDAYCVYGIAPREIASKNESLMDCPFIKKGKLQEAKKEQDKYEKFCEENEFAIIKKPKMFSQFDKNREDKKVLDQDIRKKQVLTIDDDEPDMPGDDEYAGRRIHCWVMVKKQCIKGKREIKENIFIEPSTGRIYLVDSQNQPYISVDAIFNNKNFWINLKPDFPIHEIHFDEMKLKIPQNTEQNPDQEQKDLEKQLDECAINWEYVMLDIDEYGKDQEDNEEIKMEAFESEQKKEMAELGELDMPPSWSPKIEIDKEKFLKRTPQGEQSIFYKRSKVDKYGPYEQNDGLIERITIYEDYRRLKIIEIREFYENRPDKLMLRRRYPFENQIIEEYLPGQKFNWKQVNEVNQRLRVIRFYPNRNQDGLIEREERIGEKTIEKYENRDDRVCYRSIRFIQKEKTDNKDQVFKDNHLENVVLIKLTQKFAKNSQLPGRDQISKMIVDLIKNKVIVIYHLNEGDIAPKIKEYPRESILGIQKLSDQSGDQKADDPVQQQENYKIQEMEKLFLQQIKTAEQAAQAEEVEIRSMRITINELEKPLHIKAREKSKQAKTQKEAEMQKEKLEADYLYPYLEKKCLLGKDKLNREEAIAIKNEVMQKLRDRLLSRVDIIQKRLTEEKHKLDLEQQRISKKGGETKEEENNQVIQDLTFKISILDERAARFELMAFTKFEEMDHKLNEDPRLEEMHKPAK